jgi:hypothetical protein
VGGVGVGWGGKLMDNHEKPLKVIKNSETPEIMILKLFV